MPGVSTSRLVLGAFGVIAATLVLAACQQAEPTATPVPPTATRVPATPTLAPTAMAVAAPITSFAIALKELNTSGQTGHAVLTAKGEQTEVVLKATAGISRANHIHSGTCATLGGVAHPLTNMADGSSVTTVNASLSSLLTGGFAINLHNATNAGVYTSCGDIPAQGKVLVVELKELKASGQTGTATLISSAADKTDVVLVATTGISRANHIHSGTCAQLGGVAHGLTNMADGVSVATVNAGLDSLRTGAFAINLHKATDASVYTACGDIPKP